MTDPAKLHIPNPLLLDGGLSNELEKQGHDLNHALWSAQLLDSEPEAIVKAHLAYLDAGARCITTASYQASIPGLLAAGHDEAQAKALIVKSVELAELAIERFIAGGYSGPRPLIAASIGPYGAYLADGSEYHGNYDISRDALHAFHASRMELLDRSKADIIACETIPSFGEAQVLAEILSHTQKPAWLSFSCKDGDHINDGTPIRQCAELLKDHPNIFAVGVNCTSPVYISDLIQHLKKYAGNKRFVVYPNSGESYDPKAKSWKSILAPDMCVQKTQEWLDLGADIIGGCCRIGPDQIQLMREKIWTG